MSQKRSTTNRPLVLLSSSTKVQRVLRAYLPSAVTAVLAAALLCPSPAAASTVLDAGPTTVSFNDHGIHDGNWETQKVVLTDTSGTATTVSSVALSGAEPGQFSIAYDNCTNRFMSNPGDQCDVGVQFGPSTVGSHSASLDVEDTSGTTSVSLSGNGITGGLVSDPSSIAFTPQPYQYGNQQQGFQLRNPSGVASVQVGSATITGPDAGSFSIAWGTNCLNWVMWANNTCGMGVAFNPTGPGTFNAQLEVSSDASDSPLVIPISATALSGPRLVVTPSRVVFGDVRVGRDASATLTLSNAGDYPLQSQGMLFVTGRPDVFFSTDDTCTGRALGPGESCTVVVHFKPTSAGEKDAPLLLIGDNGFPTLIGISGKGVVPVPPPPPPPGGGKDESPPAPRGTVNLLGTPVVGGELTCRPLGYDEGTSFSYRWLRNGKAIGSTGATLPVSYDDLGARFACELTASSAGGTQTVASPRSAPVAPRDLSRQSGAFTDERICREVQRPRSLTVGSVEVAIDGGTPITPWAPLTLRAASPVTVSVDGTVLGRGRRVTVSPRALAAFTGGVRTLRLSTDGASAQTSIALAPCRLALRASGGAGRHATLAVSARAGVRSLKVSLPRSLRLRIARGVELGSAWIKSAGYPARTFDLVGPRTRSNGVTVKLTRRGFSVTGLPGETAVVRLRLARGLLSGKAGTARVSAKLEGGSVRVGARAAVNWLR